MKRFTEEKFDKFVRDSLYNYEQQPPLEVYNNLKKEILPRQGWSTLKIFGISSLLVAVVLIVFFNVSNENADIKKQNFNLVNEQTISEKPENDSFISNNYNNPSSKSINKNNQLAENKSNVAEINNEKPLYTTANNKIEQDLKNIQEYASKKEITYEVRTKASTCKQWNGKAIILCNVSDVMFFWKDLNITKHTVENLKYGTYTVLAKKADEVIDTIIINIPDSGSVKADFKVYETVLGNEVMFITENSTLVEKKLWKNNNNVSFYWNFGDGSIYTQAEPTHSYSQSGNYSITLVVRSIQGCTDSITKSYIVEIPLNFVELPNIFSPNADGIHDIFSPVLYDMQSIECSIFDRNGVLIYEWKDVNGYWDGKIRNTNKMASPGTYFYILKGVTKTGKQILHKGMVQLVL